jgi:cytochrome P450
VGAPLARLELDVSLGALVDRCPRLELVAEPRYHDAFVIHGLREVRVRATGT